jgi:hypothetical protein
LNEDEVIVENEKTLKYRVKTCRVQSARRAKGLRDFPCKPVGLVEYDLFAKTIDGRFATEALSCPPDISDPACSCFWKFTLRD